MRNHRKIVVIDNRITYCGSNNCADAAFAIKPKFAPWVDAMIRFEGPIARQNQHVFATDWMGHVKENLSDLFNEPLEIGEGFPAQVIATGATVRYSAMPEMFESLMYAARRELVITSLTTFRTSPSRPRSAPAPAAASTRPSSSRPRTTAGSWRRPATATTRSSSTPA